MSSRLLLGLSDGFEAVNAALIRVDGLGLTAAHRIVGVERVPTIDPSRRGMTSLSTITREIAQVLVHAARSLAVKSGVDLRKVQAAGVLVQESDSTIEWIETHAAERFAELTGLSVLVGFSGRDSAAEGTGRPITAAADAILYHSHHEDRLLIHLGAVTSLLLIPKSGKLTELIGFDSGPGTRLLDDITLLGTRGKENFDHGGNKAVQGRCLEELLQHWLHHPYFLRRPPKMLAHSVFGAEFQTEAFRAAKDLEGTLQDLLCTATHFVARSVGDACSRWLPEATRILVSGGGTRNGFLLKLLEAGFPGHEIERLDVLGVPVAARGAAASAVLSALTLDGVCANLPLLTGATGARLVGRFIPGDFRNWAACTAWMSERLADYGGLSRAA